MIKYECIISRYNEYIDFVKEIINLVDVIIIYNKGFNQKFFKEYIPTPEHLQKLRIINVVNVGRINHSISCHIVSNWEYLNLNPNIVLISLPGSIKMNQYKGMYLNKIKKQIKNGFNKGFYSPLNRQVSEDFDYLTLVPHKSNIYCNVSNSPFIKSEYSSLKEYKSKLIDPVIGQIPLKEISLRSMFMVCSENIVKIDKQVYQNILGSLSVGDNLENGLYVERLWSHLLNNSQ